MLPLDDRAYGELHKLWEKKRTKGYDKTKDVEGRKRRRERNRAWLNEYKSQRCCSRCGESHIAALDFHHLDPSKKEFNVSRGVLGWHSLRSMEKEAKKCIILCSNCHRKLHYDERVGPT